MPDIGSLPFAPSKAEPNLSDLLNLLKKDIFLNLNCHHIGTVQSFDETQQTAIASVNYKRTFFKLNQSTGLYDSVLVDYPLLLDCPVIVLGGGSGALTFPVSNGDECLVLFNDRDMSNWFQGAGNGAVASARFHSFSDGVILVGLRSLANVLTNYDVLRVVLRNGLNGSTMVGVGPTLIKIANQTTTLNALLQQLITQIEALVTATAAITVTAVTPGVGVSGPPANAAAITAVGTALAATAVQIAGLLE